MAFTPEQLKAINFSGDDLIVSAAAGSGKTTTLIKRITDKIENGADVSRMLIVTFTKAAANELRTRLTRALSEKLKEDKGNPHLTSQIVRVGSADICTIDSFCIKIVRPNFDKVGIDSAFRIGEESEIALLCKEAMEDTVEAFNEAEIPDKDFLAVSDCFGNMGNDDVLCESLLSLRGKLISTPKSIELLRDNASLEDDFLLSPYGKVLLTRLGMTVKHFYELYGKMCNKCENDAGATQCLNTLYSDRDFMERLLLSLKNPKYKEIQNLLNSYAPVRFVSPSKDSLVDKEWIKGERDNFKTAIKTFKEKYFSADEGAVSSAFIHNGRICNSVYKVLKTFENEFERRKKSHSVCDFNDIERYALKILYNDDGTPSSVAMELRGRYDEVYIDEYQDTNSVQDSIFSAISNHNRFMVGDIKQSIYRFRSAEPEIFAHYRNSFTPMDSHISGKGASLFMSNNFRSDKGVIDFANLVSDYTFMHSQGIPYSAEDKLIYSKTGADVYEKAEICLINEAEDGECDIKNPEAELVAKKIRAMLETGYLPDGSKIHAENICIMLRSLKNLKDYLEALKKYGVRSEFISEDKFFERSEVLFVLCLLNIIDNPSRDVYLAGALRSPIFGFEMAELIDIKRYSKDAPSLYEACKRYDRDEKLTAKLCTFFEKIEKYRKTCRKLPTHDIISMLYTDAGILSSSSRTERKNLLKLYDIARGYEGNAYKGLSAFLRYVEKVSSQRDREEIRESSSDNVRIMTIHASKGLEFDICFLCETDKRFNKMDNTAPLLFERSLGVSGYLYREGGYARYNTLMRKCASLAVDKAGVEEEMRILYVALTRAKQKMIVTASVKDARDFVDKKVKERDCISEYSVLRSSSHIDWIVGAWATDMNIADLHIIESEADEEKILDTKENKLYYDKAEVEKIEDILRERFDFSYEYEHLNKLPSKLSVSDLYPKVLDNEENSEIEQNISIDIMPDFLGVGEKPSTAAERGTSTHLFMQFCDFEKLKSTGSRAELDRLYENSYISERVKELVNLKHIDAFAKSELFSELLSAKRIIREFRFNVMISADEFTEDERLKNEKVLVQGVTDCIYENEAGELILVDYKTDRVSYDNYVEELTLRHKNQLTYYKKACEMMFERPIDRVIIYSVPLAKNVEVKI